MAERNGIKVVTNEDLVTIAERLEEVTVRGQVNRLYVTGITESNSIRIAKEQFRDGELNGRAATQMANLMRELVIVIAEN